MEDPRLAGPKNLAGIDLLAHEVKGHEDSCFPFPEELDQLPIGMVDFGL